MPAQSTPFLSGGHARESVLIMNLDIASNKDHLIIGHSRKKTEPIDLNGNRTMRIFVTTH
jgi:hypothetical protein